MTTAATTKPQVGADAERHVIGALLLDTRRLPDVAEILHTEHFADRRHRAIYSTVIDLHDNGQPVDVVTVSDRLERRGQLRDIGGLSYLAQLAQQVATTANVISYARTVADRAMDRALQRAGADIAQLVERDLPVAQKIDLAGEILVDLSRQSDPGEIRPLTQIIAGAVDEIETRFEAGGGIAGDSTGFESLDQRWDGLNAGDLIVLAARPSMGKTALAMNIAAHVAASRPVAVFELEMPGAQLVKRMLSSAGQLPYRKIKRGDLAEYDWPKVTAAIGRVSSLKLYIDDRAYQPMGRIRTFARKVKRQQRDLGLVVIDYLQIMDDEARRGESRAMAVQRITTQCKALAKELECAVILVSQLNRDSDKRMCKRPQLSDLRDSGSIEQDADIVAFVHREDQYREQDDAPDNLAEIITAKNRNGETGVDCLEWRGEYQAFSVTNRVSQRKPRPTGKRGIDV